MTPPKCFFKRPEEFYSNCGNLLQAPKLECHSPGNSSTNEEISPTQSIKTEPLSFFGYNEFCQLSRSQQSTPIPRQEHTNESVDTPLDLSCKCSEADNNELLKKLSSFLLQHQQQLSRINQTVTTNHYINLKRFFCQLPQTFYQLPTAAQRPNPKVYVTPPIRTDTTLDTQSKFIDPLYLSAENQLLHHSPESATESTRDNSSSEASCQYPVHGTNRTHKRKVDRKVLRPFKLYKGSDSQGLMEALGINEEDEEWLKSIVEYKSVDDVFLFLTSCMNDDTKPVGLTDDIIDKIKTKFGHIFQNCNTSISNPRMVRHPDMTPKELKTDEYWEKRRKNNDAAKRSREARRHKEDNLNQHCEKLQSENDSIRKEIERVKLKIDEIKRSIS